MQRANFLSDAFSLSLSLNSLEEIPGSPLFYRIFFLSGIKTIKSSLDKSVLEILSLRFEFSFFLIPLGHSSTFFGAMQSTAATKRTNPILKFALVTLTVLLLLDVAQATFKKPPFNGSIFGKRANGVSDYDSAGRTLSSLCEVAVEACSVWFPQMEAKK